VISSTQRPLPDNTQHSQQTNIHAPGVIRTNDLSRRAVVDLRLKPHGHWDRQRVLFKLYFFIYIFNFVMMAFQKKSKHAGNNRSKLIPIISCQQAGLPFWCTFIYFLCTCMCFVAFVLFRSCLNLYFLIIHFLLSRISLLPAVNNIKKISKSCLPFMASRLRDAPTV
jgi:hypothetical protein